MLGEVVEHAFGETRPDTTGQPQLTAAVVDGQDQRTDPTGAPALARSPAGDQNLLRPHVLYLPPVR
jgi:hypothetical protein